MSNAARLRWEPCSGGSPHRAPPPPSSPQRTIKRRVFNPPRNGRAAKGVSPPNAPGGAGELGRSRPWMVHAEAGTLRVLPAGLSGGAGAEPESPAALRGKLGVRPCRIASLLLWFAWLQRELSSRVGSVSPRVWRAATGGHDGADFWDGSVLLSPTSEAPPGCPGPARALRGCHELQGQLPPFAGCPALAIVPAPASLSCTSPAAPRPLSPPRGGGRCLQRCSSSLCCRVLLLELRFSRPCRFAAGVRPACFAGRGALNTSDPPPQAAFCPAPLPPHHYLSLPRAPCPHTAPCRHIFQPKTRREPDETLRVPEDPRTGCAMGSHGRSHPKSLGSAWPQGQLWGPLSGHPKPHRDTGTLSQGSAPAGPSRTGWIGVLPSPSEPRCHQHRGTADPEATRERFPMNWHPLRLCQTPVPSAEGGTDPPGPPRPWEGSVKGGRGSSRTQPDIFLSCVGGSDLVWSTFEQEARCHPVPAAWPHGEDQKGVRASAERGPVGQHRRRAGFVLLSLHHTSATASTPLTAGPGKGWAQLRHGSCAGLWGPRAAQALVPAGGRTERWWEQRT